MKKIDYENIVKLAAQINISPQLLLKRQLHYRYSRFAVDYPYKKCESCKNFFSAPWKDYDGKFVCAIIGVKKEFDAFVKYDHVCDKWSRK